MTCPQHCPSESRTTPACCACGGLSLSRELQQPFCHSLWYFFLGKKKGFSPEKKWPQRKWQGRSDTWILLWHQPVSVRPRPKNRAVLSQFAWPKSWHTACSEYPGDMLSFWHLSYLPDKHNCPQQRGICCFWHWLLISHIYLSFSPVLMQCTHICYSTLSENATFLIQYSAPLLLSHVTFPTTTQSCALCTVLPCPPYCSPRSFPQLLGATTSPWIVQWRSQPLITSCCE